MIHPTLFCTYEALDEIITFQEEHPELYNILYNHSNIVIDSDDDEVDNIVGKDPYLKVLAKRPNFGPLQGAKEVFENIESLDVEEHPYDLFIVDRDPSTCIELQTDLGVCILSEKALKDIAVLKSKLYKVLIQGELWKDNLPDGQSVEGWEAVLKDLKVVPINSLILIDDYLFSPTVADGEENLISLLKKVLPATLKVDFHLMIITSNENAHLKGKNLKRVADRINSIGRPYRVNTSLMTHNNNPIFHKRVIVTNYHLLYCDQGFKVFKAGKVKLDNDFNLKGAYHSVCDVNCDIELKQMFVQLKKASIHLAKRPTNGFVNPTDLYFGDCQNRLLKNIS
jgi:hypothetical protein